MADEIKPIKIPTRITAAQIEMIKAGEKRDKVRLELDKKVASKLAAELRLRELRALPESPEVPAWCTDLTEDLTGEVATIEVPGEGLQNLLVAPGYDGAGGYLPARDGRVASRAGMNPLQLYLAAALLPGWQKFRPTYRFGTITAIDYNTDTANVALADARSSAQDLQINLESSLRDVPVVYMSCDSGAFEIGDEVVVRFVDQDWTKPTVIGFKSRPKGCNAGLYCIPATPLGQLYIPPEGEGLLGETRSFAGNRGDEDFIGAWALKTVSGLPAKTWITVAYGNRTWYGPGGLVLSWHGHPSRVYKPFLAPTDGARTHEYTFDSPTATLYTSSGSIISGRNILGARSFFPGRRVFYRQDVLLDLGDYGIDAQMVVVGAAIAGDTLRVVIRTTLIATTRTHELHEFALSRSGTSITVTGGHTVVDSLTTSDVPITDWYFSADGHEAVCTMHGANIVVHRIAGVAFSVLRTEPFAAVSTTSSITPGTEPTIPSLGARSYDSIEHVGAGAGSITVPAMTMLCYADYVGNHVVYAEWHQDAIISSTNIATDVTVLIWNTGDDAGVPPPGDRYNIPTTTTIVGAGGGAGLTLRFSGASVQLPEPAGSVIASTYVGTFTSELLYRDGPAGMGSYPYAATFTGWDTTRDAATTTVVYAPLVIDARKRLALLWMHKRISTEATAGAFTGTSSTPNGGTATGSRTSNYTDRIEQRAIAATPDGWAYIGGMHATDTPSSTTSTSRIEIPWYYAPSESDVASWLDPLSGILTLPAEYLSHVTSAFAAGSGTELMFSFFTPGNSGGAALYPAMNGALLYRRSTAAPIDLVEHFALDRATQTLRDVSAGP